MKLPITLLSFSLPIAIVITNLLALTFSDSTYKVYFKETEDLHYVLNVVSYLKGVSQMDEDYFSSQAIAHMKDVKSLFDAAKITNALVLLVLVGTLSFLFSRKSYRQIKKAAVLGLIILTLLILMLFTASILNFSLAFTVFHKIFFKNDFWLFPADDNLVKLFSLDFFSYFIEKLITNILITLFTILLVLRFIPRHDSKNN